MFVIWHRRRSAHTPGRTSVARGAPHQGRVCGPVYLTLVPTRTLQRKSNHFRVIFPRTIPWLSPSLQGVFQVALPCPQSSLLRDELPFAVCSGLLEVPRGRLVLPITKTNMSERASSDGAGGGVYTVRMQDRLLHRLSGEIDGPGSPGRDRGSQARFTPASCPLSHQLDRVALLVDRDHRCE